MKIAWKFDKPVRLAIGQPSGKACLDAWSITDADFVVLIENPVVDSALIGAMVMACRSEPFIPGNRTCLALEIFYGEVDVSMRPFWNILRRPGFPDRASAMAANFWEVSIGLGEDGRPTMDTVMKGINRLSEYSGIDISKLDYSTWSQIE